MSFVTLPAKLDSTTIPLSVDFISQLIEGEALVAASVFVSTFSGVDAAPSAILSGSASIVRNVMTQTFTAGVVGAVYLVNFNGSTNFGNSISIQAYLAIVSSTPFN